jgi:hypothetical protein
MINPQETALAWLEANPWAKRQTVNVIPPNEAFNVLAAVSIWIEKAVGIRADNPLHYDLVDHIMTPIKNWEVYGNFNPPEPADSAAPVDAGAAGNGPGDLQGDVARSASDLVAAAIRDGVFPGGRESPNPDPGSVADAAKAGSGDRETPFF